MNIKNMTEIKIIIYNIKRLPTTEFILPEEKIKNYDIILLQECFGTKNKKKKKIIEDYCQKYGYNYKNYPIRSFLKFVDSGLVTLFKKDIVYLESYFIPFNLNLIKSIFIRALPETFANKGILYTNFKINNIIINIYNIHFISNYSNKQQNNINKFELNQLKKIFELTKNQTNVIIGGDFNMIPSSIETIPDFDKYRFKIFKPIDNTIYVKWMGLFTQNYAMIDSFSSKKKKKYKGYILDYFISKNINLLETEIYNCNDTYSDHQPVISKFIL